MDCTTSFPNNRVPWGLYRQPLDNGIPGDCTACLWIMEPYGLYPTSPRIMVSLGNPALSEPCLWIMEPYGLYPTSLCFIRTLWLVSEPCFIRTLLYNGTLLYPNSANGSELWLVSELCFIRYSLYPSGLSRLSRLSEHISTLWIIFTLGIVPQTLWIMVPLWINYDQPSNNGSLGIVR